MKSFSQGSSNSKQKSESLPDKERFDSQQLTPWKSCWSFKELLELNLAYFLCALEASITPPLISQLHPIFLPCMKNDILFHASLHFHYLMYSSVASDNLNWPYLDSLKEYSLLPPSICQILPLKTGACFFSDMGGGSSKSSNYIMHLKTHR